MRRRSDTRGVAKKVLISQQASADVFAQQYEDVRELGSGSFGCVRLVRDRATEEERVFKVMSTKGMSRNVIDMMKKEIELLKTLDHPLIMRLYEFAEDVSKQEIVLVIEFISGGDGLGLVKDSDGQPRPQLAERSVSTLIRHLIVALNYCHARGVVHRDVKPENLMLPSPVGGNAKALTCKLIDFGLAGKSQAGSELLSDFVGTPKYMAPEVHRRVPYSAKADMWSVGCTALHLLLGEAPFQRPYEVTIGRYQGFEEVEARLAELPGWQRLGDEAKDFARLLLEANPNRRPSAHDALEHEWIKAHEPAPERLTKEMARSLANYAGAPSVVRCCLMAIAARNGAPNAERLGTAFLGADADRDGLLGPEDLRGAVTNTEGYNWWWNPKANVNVEDLLVAADLDHSGGIAFTEFVAACSFGSYESTHDIAQEAFYALDNDRDGLVRVQEIVHFFRERDDVFLMILPQDRSFNIDEWCERIEAWNPRSPKTTSSAGSSEDGGRRRLGFFEYFSLANSCQRRRTNTGRTSSSFHVSFDDT